jgi:uncharacterized protein (PEP-CTERM system associated)
MLLLSAPHAAAQDSAGGSGSGGSQAFGGGRGGFLTSPGFDATGQPIPPSAPSFSALEAFGFPPNPVTDLTAPTRGRPFDIQGSLGLTAIGTDNVRNTANNRQADLGLVLLPGLQMSADSAALRGSLSYFPTASYYVNTPEQNRINHSFTGNALATLVENSVYVDMRASGGVQATSGGFAPEGSVQVDRRNQVQSTAFQVAPYLIQRLGPVGTLNTGYAYRFSNQSGNQAFAPGTTLPFFTPQSSQGHEVWLAIRSTEELGRLALQLRLVGSVFTGNGVLNDAHRYVATVQGAYALTRWVSALAEIGYEDARYGGVPETVVQEPVWGFGARFTPDPDSAIIATYRQRDGFTSAFLDAAVSLGARTRLNANYNERLGTTTTQPVELLSAISYDALGNPVDRFSGSPIVIPFAGTPIGPLGGPLAGGATGFGVPAGGSFQAVQSALRRTKSASASISQIWERDTLTLQVLWQDASPIAVAQGTVAFAQRSWSVGLTWGRLLDDDTSLSTYVQYGKTETGSSGETDNYVARMALSRRISDTVFGTVQYVYTNRGADPTADRAVQNLVLATLRKTF